MKKEKTVVRFEAWALATNNHLIFVCKCLENPNWLAINFHGCHFKILSLFLTYVKWHCVFFPLPLGTPMRIAISSHLRVRLTFPWDYFCKTFFVLFCLPFLFPAILILFFSFFLPYLFLKNKSHLPQFFAAFAGQWTSETSGATCWSCEIYLKWNTIQTKLIE